VHYLSIIVSKPGSNDNITLKLKEGTNLIWGKNGSGKTILSAAIVDSIWRPLSGEGILYNETWESIFTDITFQHDSSKFHSLYSKNEYFTLNELKGKKKDELIQKNNINSSYIFDLEELKGNKKLIKFFSTITNGIAELACYVPSPSHRENKPIFNYNDVKELLLYDNSEYYSFFKNMKKELRDKPISENTLLNEIMKNERELKEYNKGIQLIDIQSNRNDKLLNEQKKILKEIKEQNLELENLINKKDIIQNTIYDLNSISDLQIQLTKIKTQLDKENTKNKLIESKRIEIEESYSQFKDLKNINSDYLDRLQDIFSEIRNLNEKLDQTYFHIEQKNILLKKIGVVINIAAISAAGALYYFNNFSIEKIEIILGIILGSAIISSPILFIFSKLVSRNTDIIELQKEKEKVSEKLKGILKENMIELEGYRLSELYEFLWQYFEDFISFTDLKKEITDINASLLSTEELQKINEDMLILKKREEDINSSIQTKLKKIDINNSENIDIEYLQSIISESNKQIESTKETIRVKEDILNKINNEKNQAPGNSNSLTELFSKKKESQKIINDLNSNQFSLNLILDVLEEAVETREEHQLKILADTALTYFNTITSNQHIAQFTQNTVIDIVKNNSSAQAINTTLIHFFTLSIKCALSDFLLSTGISLPLIIDDPFLFMDDDRIESLKKLLKNLSKQRQIIIFSHMKDSKKWDNFIELR